VIEALRSVLALDERVAYALLFGSAARGTDRGDSDVDVAVSSAS
jgi:predicted nucleotidyltransferase